VAEGGADRFAWVDREAYPFRSRWLDLPAGRLHYVDEGDGEPVVLVHGTPDWSFLWRHVIRALAPRRRCVAMDHLGFGLSDKPAGWSYRPEDHAAHVRALVEHLGLGAPAWVVHDFGASIGLACALERAEPPGAVVVLNGWLWAFDRDRRARRVLRLLTSPPGRLLYLRANLSARVLLPRAFGERARLTAAVHRQYLAPFPTPREREGPWGMARGALASAAWLESLWARRARLAGARALLLWGMRDPACGPAYLERWREALPQAEVVTFPRAGHFPQEEEPSEVARRIAVFLGAAPA
jgi:haloalkane dehalogenase